MTILYTPDTCSCVVFIEHGTSKYVDWIQKCPGHSGFDGQQLMDEIEKQCKSFQIPIEDQQDKAKIKANVQAKRAEKIRILATGEITKNPKLIRNTLL